VNSYALPATIALVGGGVLLYLGLRRNKEQKTADAKPPATFCDIRSAAPCAKGSCIPLYEEGLAPPGYENVGVCT